MLSWRGNVSEDAVPSLWGELPPLPSLWLPASSFCEPAPEPPEPPDWAWMDANLEGATDDAAGAVSCFVLQLN
jgi:hypothetical protein